MLTIGQLIEKLQKCDKSKRVYFDFCGCVPTSVDSYRGRYSKPALGWQPSGYSNKKCIEYPTVVTLIEELENALKTTYYGWSGGEYQYNLNSELYIDNCGDATKTVAQDVREFDNAVIIETEVLYDEVKWTGIN